MAKAIAGIIAIFLMMGSVGPVLAGDWTAHGFIYKPSLGARGTAEKGRYDSGQDRVDVRLSKEIWVGDPNYGTTIQDALAAISSNQAILRVPAGPHSISSNLIVPSNVTLRVERQATLTIPQGVTLAINGGLEAGLYQIFACTGTGKVVFGRPSGVKELVPQWWGAKADGASDDIIPLQAMVDCSVDSKGLSMFCPAGTYVISDTLKLNKGVGYAGFTFKGAGSAGINLTDFNTVFDARAFGDRPAINIQGARRIVCEDFVVVGKNVAPNTAATTLDPTLANWITAGCSNTQHSPYAGISIDAYQGAAPGDPYPNDPYSRIDSSYVMLRNVHVKNFVVGLCINPSTVNVDSDAVTATSCQLAYNTFGYSSGCSQSRSIIFNNTDVYGNWCGLTTTRHGNQIGNHPSINGGIFQLAHKLFELGAGNGANAAVINGIHTESIGWLGEIGKSASGSSVPMVFSGCQMGFSGLAYQPFFLIAHRKVKFDSCVIQCSGSFVYAMNFGGDYYGPIQFSGCNFIGFANTAYAFLGLRDYYFISQTFDHCFAELIAYTDSGDITRFNPNRDIDIDGTQWANYIIRYFLTPQAATVSIEGVAYKVDKLNTTGHAVFSSTAPVVLSGTTHGSTLTFTATNAADFIVGDIIKWIVYEPLYLGVLSNFVPAFRVTENNAGAVTAVALFDGLDGTYAPSSVRVCTPFFVNPTGSTGNTHSNTTVDNVTNITNWKIGDFLRGSGIPADTRIANIVGTTITLSKAATATATGVALYNCKLTAM